MFALMGMLMRVCSDGDVDACLLCRVGAVPAHVGIDFDKWRSFRADQAADVR